MKRLDEFFKLLIIMNKYFTLIFVFTTSLFSAQECDGYKLSDWLQQKKKNDTIYREFIYKRVEYFAVLNNEILPKYSYLKNDILKSIEIVDLKEILELKNTYDTNRLNYLSEMKEAQARVFKDIIPYGKIYTIILFETLDVFPDSYAMIFNSSVINAKVKGRDVILKNKLYNKYSAKLSKFDSCFRKMKSEMNFQKAKFKVIDINQNTGNKTEEQRKKADLVDIILWAFK